jgi:hypothetical protein
LGRRRRDFDVTAEGAEKKGHEKTREVPADHKISLGDFMMDEAIRKEGFAVYRR